MPKILSSLNFIFARCLIVVIYLGSLMSAATVSQGQGLPYTTPPAWSPDGSKVAVMSPSRIEVWDVTTRQPQLLYQIAGAFEAFSPVTWSPDSSLLAAGSIDDTMMLWNAFDGTSTVTMEEQNDVIIAIAWSPDGRRIVGAGQNTERNLFVWSAQTGALIASYSGGSITDMAFSPDGQKIAVSTPLSLFVRDGSSFEVLARSARVPCCPNTMYTLAWSHDGSTLVTGSLSGLITLWDSTTAQVLQQFIANPYYEADSRDVDNLMLSWVRDAQFTIDDRSVLGISGNGAMRQWDRNSGNLTQADELPFLYSASWSPYGGRLAYVPVSSGEAAELSTEQGGQGRLNVVVPIPSIEFLELIAEGCNTPDSISQSLTIEPQVFQPSEFLAQIESLPENIVQPACAADLIAVAAALQEAR